MIFFRRKNAPAAKYNRKFDFKGMLWKIYRWILILFACALPIALISLYIYLHQANTLPIHTVKITGYYPHLDQRAIKNKIAPYADTGFFLVNLGLIQKSLLQLPWLERVSIRKVWPDTIVVDLQEFTPFAYWGKKSLLSNGGIVFTPDKIFNVSSALPKFNGADEDGKIVLDAYLQMNQMLAPLHFTVVAINFSDRQAWTVTLSNGIVLMLGRDDIWERMERFINTYQQTIGDHANQVANVDLRYENGLAVQWKK